MKKQALLLMAGGMLAFASCNTETTSTSTASDAQIDSMVNARVEEIRLDMMRQNDSMINALAQIKADSIIATMKGGGSVTKSTTTKTTAKPQGGGTTTTTTTTTKPTNPKEGRFNGQGTSNTAEKESRFSEEAAKKQQEANKKKKEERFK